MTTEFFLKRGLARSTSESYELSLRDLKKFHGDKKAVEDISYDEICSYLTAVKKLKKLSPQTRNVRIYAFNYYFNKYLGNDYDFSGYFNPRNWKRGGGDFYVPTVEEVKLIIDNAACLRDEFFYSLGYGCGLDSGEILGIKVNHVDLLRKRVRVKFNSSKKYKYLPLSNSLIECYNEYIKEYNPRKYLFFGRDIIKPLPQRTIQRASQKLIEKLPVNDKITLRSLRHAYIIHLNRYGYDLWSILNHLSLDSALSLQTYTEASSTIQEIEDSPIEYLDIELEDEPLNIDSLNNKLRKVIDGDERSYLHEAVMCLKNGLLRSGVMIAWTAAMSNINKKIILSKGSRLDSAIKSHYKDAKSIKSIDDLLKYKESTVLNTTVTIGLFDRNQKSILEECLKLRNKCSHPGKYMPGDLAVAAYIENLIRIVFVK